MKKLLSSTMSGMPDSNSQLKFYKDMAKTIGHQNSLPFDRTGSIDAPLLNTIMPEYQLYPGKFNTSFSYEECCLRKAEEILRIQDVIQKPISILYSGGIDSTIIVCSFIHLLGVKEAARRIHIYMSTDSIYEYSDFFSKILLPHFDIFPTTRFVDVFGSDIFITGDGAGTVVMTEWVEKSMKTMGTHFFKLPVNLTTLAIYARSRSKGFSYEQNHIHSLFEMNRLSADKFGIKLENMLDWVWWFNFNFKYQYYPFKALRSFRAYYPDFLVDHDFLKSHFVCFFHSDDFQSWGINHRQEQFDGVKPGRFKGMAKDFIFKITKDPMYRQLKGKARSLSRVNVMDKLVFGIDEDYKPIHESEIENYLVDSAFLSSFV